MNKENTGSKGVTEAKGKDFQDGSSVSESSNKMTSRMRSSVWTRKKRTNYDFGEN